MERNFNFIRYILNSIQIQIFFDVVLKDESRKFDVWISSYFLLASLVSNIVQRCSFL